MDSDTQPINSMPSAIDTNDSPLANCVALTTDSTVNADGDDQPLPKANVLSLPTETLVDIMQYLSYFDLKCCRRVCKRLHNVVESKQLQVKLFQSPPADTLDVSTIKSFDMHPLLLDPTDDDSLVKPFHIDHNDMSFTLDNSKDAKVYYFKDLYVSSREFATQPAVKELKIVIKYYGDFNGEFARFNGQIHAESTVSNPNGVTVEDFWTGFSKALELDLRVPLGLVDDDLAPIAWVGTMLKLVRETGTGGIWHSWVTEEVVDGVLCWTPCDFFP